MLKHAMRTTQVRVFGMGLTATITIVGARTLQAMPAGVTAQTHFAWHTDSIPVGTVTGRVIDSETKRPVEGVKVNVSGTILDAVTSDSGTFTLRDVPAANHILIAIRYAYRPTYEKVVVTANQLTTVQLSVQLEPRILAGVVTTDMDIPDQPDPTRTGRDTTRVK